MSARIIPFMRDQSVYPGGCSARGTAPVAPPPNGDRGQPIPADLEALIASHADDLRMGSLCDHLADLIERAADERGACAHRPVGVMADIALDGLLKVKADLDATIRSLSARSALAEARELDRELSNMNQDEALALWRELTPAQRSAVIFVQSEAMTPGGVA